MKRFFIRKSPNDLIQEQNRLLETLLEKQDEKLTLAPRQPKRIEAYEDQVEPTSNMDEVMDFDFKFEDDMPYIPMTNRGEANLPSLDVEKSIFENDSVEKLRRKKIIIT